MSPPDLSFNNHAIFMHRGMNTRSKLNYTHSGTILKIEIKAFVGLKYRFCINTNYSNIVLEYNEVTSVGYEIINFLSINGHNEIFHFLFVYLLDINKLLVIARQENCYKIQLLYSQ